MPPCWPRIKIWSTQFPAEASCGRLTARLVQVFHANGKEVSNRLRALDGTIMGQGDVTEDSYALVTAMYTVTTSIFVKPCGIRGICVIQICRVELTEVTLG